MRAAISPVLKNVPDSGTGTKAKHFHQYVRRPEDDPANIEKFSGQYKTAAGARQSGPVPWLLHFGGRRIGGPQILAAAGDIQSGSAASPRVSDLPDYGTGDMAKPQIRRQLTCRRSRRAFRPSWSWTPSPPVSDIVSVNIYLGIRRSHRDLHILCFSKDRHAHKGQKRNKKPSHLLTYFE